MVGLLKHADEGILGNTALCLAHCTQVDDVCKRLSKTSIIMHLLVLARDGRPPALQQNAAILIAKLAQGHPRSVCSCLKVIQGQYAHVPRSSKVGMLMSQGHPRSVCSCLKVIECRYAHISRSSKVSMLMSQGHPRSVCSCLKVIQGQYAHSQGHPRSVCSCLKVIQGQYAHVSRSSKVGMLISQGHLRLV